MRNFIRCNLKKLKQRERDWYQLSYTWLTLLFLPLSWLFRLVVAVRYFLYRYHLKKSIHFSVPVIVVGNITVGGTGKTPFVIWLANYLQQKGYRPGIVTRGVGGKMQSVPYWVDNHADPTKVGDEAILLSRRTRCPVVICRDRPAAVAELLQKSNCNVVISDDGLQHYRLGRQVEIAMVDGQRKFGNGELLPAGPLREPISRLKRIPFVVWQQGNSSAEWIMTLVGRRCLSVGHSQQECRLSDFANQTVHAVAGVGYPERFFDALRAENIQIIPHVFPDHYLYQPSDICFSDELPVLMTEKDAVKCIHFADHRHWYLPVDAKVDNALGEKVIAHCRFHESVTAV